MLGQTLTFHTWKGFEEVECLLCYERFVPPDTPRGKAKKEILSDLFNVFSKSMNWVTLEDYQFDFNEDQFPFCSSCRISLVRVYKLNEQLQSIISSVSAKMLERSRDFNSTRCTDEAPNKLIQFYRRQTLTRFQSSVSPSPNKPSYNTKENDQNIVMREEIPVSMDQLLSSEVNNCSFPPSPESSVFVPCIQILTPSLELGHDPGGVQTVEQSSMTEKYLAGNSTVNDRSLDAGEAFIPVIDPPAIPEPPNYSTYSLKILEASPEWDNDGAEDSRSIPTSAESTNFHDFESGQEANSQRSQTIAQPHVCTICGRSFGRKYVLTRHVLLLHTKDSDKPFACPSCDNKYVSQSLLKDHVRKTHNKRDISNPRKEDSPSLGGLYTSKVLSTTDFKCQVCGQSFAQESILGEHVRDCRIDSALNQTGSSLESDMSELLDVKVSSSSSSERLEKDFPFPCDLCTRNFKYRIHLRKHLKDFHVCDDQHKTLKTTVSDEDKISCRLCGKRFAFRYNLHRHFMAFHTDDKCKPFKCTDCDQRFAKECFLTDHVKSIHQFINCDLCSGTYTHHRIFTHKYVKHRLRFCKTCKQFIPLGSFKEHVNSDHACMDKKNAGAEPTPGSSSSASILGI